MEMGLIIDNRNCWCSSRINARHDREAKDVWMKGEDEGLESGGTQSR